MRVLDSDRAAVPAHCKSVKQVCRWSRIAVDKPAKLQTGLQVQVNRIIYKSVLQFYTE